MRREGFRDYLGHANVAHDRTIRHDEPADEDRSDAEFLEAFRDRARTCHAVETEARSACILAVSLNGVVLCEAALA